MAYELDLLKAVLPQLAAQALTSLRNAVTRHRETKASQAALEKLDRRAAEMLRDVISSTDPTADFSDLIEELEALEAAAKRKTQKSKSARKALKSASAYGRGVRSKKAKKKAGKKKAKKAVRRKASKSKARGKRA